MGMPMHATILALTRRGAPQGCFDLWVLRSAPARFLAEISMSVYLLHQVPLELIDALLPRDSAPSVVAKCASLLVTMACAWLLTFYFERPVGRAIVKLHQRCQSRK